MSNSCLDGAVRFVPGPPGGGPASSSGAQSGRVAIAARPLRQGEVVLSAPALGVVLHEECRGRRCDWCFVATSTLAQATKRCSRCKCVFYCDRSCQEEDWKAGHKLECSARGILEQKLAEEGIHGPAAVKDALLAGRCIRAATAAKDMLGASGTLADLETLEDRTEAGEREQWQRMASVAATHAPQLLGGVGGDGAAHLADAFSRFRNNNFAVVDDLFIPIGAGCFPKGAALNHSCAPNCVLGYTLVAGQRPQQVIRVMEDLAEGAELTHSYVEMALPTWERQAQLQETYGFECRCTACASGSRSVMDALLVADAAGQGAVPRGEQAPLCPLPLAPPCADRDHELTRADTLMCEAVVEEDAEKEVRLLEEVCRLRERWLCARHVEVVAAHAAAHTAAVAAGAWTVAERQCELLVKHYVEVYPAWHPITGLQMYTLAELMEQGGREAEACQWYQRACDILRLTHGEDHGLVRELHHRLQELA